MLFLDNCNSIWRKIFVISLNLNGITVRSKNPYKWILVVIFHVALTASYIQTFACIFTENTVKDYYIGLFITEILTTILWWTLFLRKKHLDNLIRHFSSRKPKASESLTKSIILTVGTIFMFPPAIILLSNIENVTYFSPTLTHRRNCRSFWLLTTNVYSQIFVSVQKGIVTYMQYSMFFACFITFSICCLLILKRLSDTEKLLPFVDPRTAWKEIRFYVCAVNELDRTMSFPVFLLLFKIATDVFNFLSRVAGVERAANAKKELFISTPLLGIWFLIIVVLGDLIQNKCLIILNDSYECLNQARYLGYYDYKKMKLSLNLTIWKMLKINRNLLLTAFTFVVTYGVIITQYKISI